MQLNLWIPTQEHERTTESNMAHCRISLTALTTSDTTASHWKGVAAFFVGTSFKAQHHLLMSKPFTHLKGRHMKYVFPFHSEKPFEKLITSAAKVCGKNQFPKVSRFSMKRQYKNNETVKQICTFWFFPKVLPDHSVTKTFTWTVLWEHFSGLCMKT